MIRVFLYKLTDRSTYRVFRYQSKFDIVFCFDIERREVELKLNDERHSVFFKQTKVFANS